MMTSKGLGEPLGTGLFASELNSVSDCGIEALQRSDVPQGHGEVRSPCERL